MLASARECPSPADAIAAVDHFRRAARSEAAADYHFGAVGVEAIEMPGVQQRQQHRRFASDHLDPSSGAVGGGEGLDNFHAGGKIDVETTVTFRHEHPKASCRRELCEQIEREPAAGVDLGAARAD